MPKRPTNPAASEAERDDIDAGALRDKVAVKDPAAVPLNGDSEAAGAPVPAAATEQAARQQAAAALRAVPKLDRDRAVSTADYPEASGSRSPIAIALAASLAGVAAFVAITLVFTLP